MGVVGQKPSLSSPPHRCDDGSGDFGKAETYGSKRMGFVPPRSPPRERNTSGEPERKKGRGRRRRFCLFFFLLFFTSAGSSQTLPLGSGGEGNRQELAKPSERERHGRGTRVAVSRTLPFDHATRGPHLSVNLLDGNSPSVKKKKNQPSIRI